jgi:hypothetical protein
MFPEPRDIRPIGVSAARSEPRCDWSGLFANRKVEMVEKELLLVEYHGRPADSLRLKSDGYFDTVRDLDEGNAAVHSVVFTVKGHRPFNLADAFALAIRR